MKELKPIVNCLFIFIISLVFSTNIYSQYYSSGQDPASIRWKQINSGHFQVIYPIGYDSMAQYVMNVMEYGRYLSMKNYQIEPKKVSIILHNQTIVSNAEVAWAPSRMEFYTATPQSTYSQLWYEQLAIHEYTHVLQISSMNQGLTKFLRLFFGEQITVGIFGLYIPFWFVEGDAVVAETALSKSGRGRDPNFEAELRAQLLEKGPYSIEKAALGSYEDFTPDRYHLGYYLVGQAKAKFGKEVWQSALKYSGAIPYTVVPFSIGIKKETGLNKKGLYINTLAELTDKWLVQLLATKPEYAHTITKANSYTNYSFNTFLSSNKIFSLKKDYHDIGRFVIMDTTGHEETIFNPGYYFSDAVSVAGDWVCWAEYQFDPRWNYRTYGKILLLNIKTKEKKILLKKTRYFSPNISPSASKIVVTKVGERGNNSLLILDAHDGHILQEFHTADNGFFAHPSWSQDENKIVTEVLNETGKALFVYSLKTGNFQQITPYTSDHIQYPKFWEHYILYEASYSGVMDVYAIDMRSKSIYKTTSAPYSASDYSISKDGQQIIYSNYTSDGKQLVIDEWNPKQWTPIAAVKNQAYQLADILSAQIDSTLNPNYIPQENYEEKKYSKFTHLLNIHSWSLVNFDANYGSLNPGIVLLTQNKLSTLSASVGADYNINMGKMRYYANVNYYGWFPVISFGTDYRSRFVDEVVAHKIIRHYYEENNVNATVYVPLRYVSGLWTFSIQPSLSFNYKNLIAGPDIKFEYHQIKSTNYYLSFAGSKKSPYQNIYPSWGYSLSMGYKNTPFNSATGEMFSLGAAGYIHGLFRHDGFRLLAQYQDKMGDSKFYNDYVAPSRGYSGISYEDLVTFRADYQVPILYPDWNLGSVVYFKRFVLGLFYDYSQILNISSSPNDFWSSGAELSTDIHILRSKVPFKVGVRTIYINGYGNSHQGIHYEFIYSLGI
jgi:Tol biopolymer transport system component